MKTITYYEFQNKPNYISIHKYKNSDHYTAFQWYSEIYLQSCSIIGVWHIKYKDIDCNFS